MEELNKLIYDSLERYFTVLEKVGYTSETNVNKLILLQFLQEFIQNYESYITEADYTKIESIIQCLSGTSCLIPYKQYKQMNLPVNGYTVWEPVRITEDEVIRHTEAEDGLRLVNQ